ncbi:hypothetical protein Bca52824_095462 [Brassica carinata]|uniref:chitinase n=1 Tax=Brassica carinata TaxID=52824 RepID=A0A8X7P218_BRACI|nr:hypothetical protein Bca52824_095462 [Brassica carinata]
MLQQVRILRTTEAYCEGGCQSQCTPTPIPPAPTPTPPSPTPPGPSGDLSDIFSRDQFYTMLLHMNDNACPARGFFTYDAFITAAKSFPSFGNTGDLATRKKEIAAFFGQTSHETTGPKPSCHDVITGQWQPSAADIAAGRLPGYGLITNIINGGLECSGRNVPQVKDRISFYTRYCGDKIFGVDPGSNLDCDKQRPFNEGSNVFLDAAI